MNSSKFMDEQSNLSMPAATVIPVLQYPDVPTAVAWLCAAFGFSERLRIGSHRVQLSVGSGALVIAQGPQADAATFATGHSVMIRVHSADHHFAQASRAGARILSPPVNQPYGERQYSAQDPSGHVWLFSQTTGNTEPCSWGGELVEKNMA